MSASTAPTPLPCSGAKSGPRNPAAAKAAFPRSPERRSASTSPERFASACRSLAGSVTAIG
ncbi:Uncharacterised protein [Mycobacteroides abscessus subsp. abscessus]|nr:Uncharacterised protein [Mycobacteroides abscessus subsp. abscessus]